MQEKLVLNETVYKQKWEALDSNFSFFFFSGCEVATQLNEQNLVRSILSCQCSTCLHSVFEGTGEKEKSSRMLESLFSQQREGVLQCCFPPPVLAEVVVEKLCHFDVLLRPAWMAFKQCRVTGLQHFWQNWACMRVLCKFMSILPTCTVPKPLPSFSWRGKI